MELLSVLALALGIAVGSIGVWFTYRIKIGNYRTYAAQILRQAETDADALRKEADLAAKSAVIEQEHRFEERKQREQQKLRGFEERLKEREDRLDKRYALLERKSSEVDKREASLATVKEQLEQEQRALAVQEQKQADEMAALAGMTVSEAKEQLLQKTQREISQELAALIRRRQQAAQEEADRCARAVIATAINRLAVPCVSDAAVTTVSLPSDDIKGRIIGREGRNIRILEKATGVNFIIDDTPCAVVISGHDPIRKQVAKQALTDLVVDGRIHPTRIEESVTRAKELVEKQIQQHGEDAAVRIGAIDLNPELVRYLGKLNFRYSLGQNVLAHSLEVSYLLGIMAAELGLDQTLARRIGLLHDVGKAATHEMSGSHARIGHELALKYGESEDVANGIGCHHGEMDPITIEGSLCSAADAISASRLGARIEAVEQYLRRNQQLEELAKQLKGVERVYALQAGRELRVIVRPDQVEDCALPLMARELSQLIEKKLTYPGKIRITIMRETSAVEYAL